MKGETFWLRVYRLSNGKYFVPQVKLSRNTAYKQRQYDFGVPPLAGVLKVTLK